MQFHTDGYQAGDPDVRPAAPDVMNGQGDLPAQMDVLIVGSGPAGLTVAAQLSQFPDIVTRVVERRDGPLALGQADGIAARTVEMFHAFGFSHRIVREGYWVNEATFWRPDPADRTRITRTGRIDDTPEGTSEFPHLIINQARVHDYFLDVMADSARRLHVDYGYECVAVSRGEGSHPVVATLRAADGSMREVRAKYVVGADGARSAVRRAIGSELRGEAANHAWGVLDILPRTDFPDIRLKAAIQSGNGGNILLIPREGGHLVRLYVDLGDVPADDAGAIRRTPVEDILAVANNVLHPYTLEAPHIAWFSVYEVGQRLTDRFDDATAGGVGDRAPRVFIAGDACHTHSAKAGQGMNVGMQDGFNLGWKLAAVLRGHSHEPLLSTYSEERQRVAQTLIDFDKEWSAMMAAPPSDPAHPERGGVNPQEVQEYFARSLQYTAGVATRYPEGPLIGSTDDQPLASGFPVGMRFHSAPVIRIADAKRVQLGHVHLADGAWRLYVFADRDELHLNAFAQWAADPSSALGRLRKRADEPDSPVDLRAIYQRSHRVLSPADLPPAFLPAKGRYGLVDYEKAFAPDFSKGSDIFDERGIDRDRGVLVLVRPDQYVAQVLPLDGTDALASFLEKLFIF